MTAEKLIQASRTLTQQLSTLRFPEPVAYTYLPTDYARTPHEEYLSKFASTTKEVLFLGMNPGPYGMAQTGIPFGEIDHVKNWMGICTAVDKPENEHPKRPIDGFDCQKSEVSGKRLWGYFKDTFGTAEQFFDNHFVANYCPLVWMTETGANITPDKLAKDVMKPVQEACDAHLITLIETLSPNYLIGVGAYAEKKLQQAAKQMGNSSSYQIHKILHPSPASPLANRGWAEQAAKQLQEIGINLPD